MQPLLLNSTNGTGVDFKYNDYNNGGGVRNGYAIGIFICRNCWHWTSRWNCTVVCGSIYDIKCSFFKRHRCIQLCYNRQLQELYSIYSNEWCKLWQPYAEYGCYWSLWLLYGNRQC